MLNPASEGSFALFDFPVLAITLRKSSLCQSWKVQPQRVSNF